MRAFHVINKTRTLQLQRQFAPLSTPDGDLTDFPYQARISVFDHYLNAVEAMELIAFLTPTAGSDWRQTRAKPPTHTAAAALAAAPWL